MGRNRLLASVLLTSLACFGMLGLAVGLGWSPHLGLDLEGGLSVNYQPAHKVSRATLQDVANIMINRADALGLSQPNITVEGNQVVVQLPGIKDPNRALSIIGTTAQLFFRPVIAGAPAYTPPKGHKKVAYRTPPQPTGGYRYTSSYYVAGTGTNGGQFQCGTFCEDPVYASYKSTSPVDDNPAKPVIFPSGGSYAPRLVLGPALASGTIIKNAYGTLDQLGNYVVAFNLTGSGSPIFNRIAKAYYETPVADDLDGDIVSAPLIESQSFPGSGQISGNFTQSSANNLALDLNYGSLPVRMVALTSQTVSPSLGKSSLRAGMLAGLLGLLLVMGYTIFYYRALGIVVVMGLVTTAAFLYGLISLLSVSSYGLTLDLSGVTGLIVSVGITVDSYIVYFERLKDEIRAGRSVRASVDKGFRSAYRTILSADAVSFIGALVLWILSVGAVRGFAFMLGISTLTDVATAYLFTRPFVILLGRNRVIASARHLGIARGLASPTPEAA